MVGFTEIWKESVVFSARFAGVTAVLIHLILSKACGWPKKCGKIMDIPFKNPG
jgi:hypothetical protein